MSAGDFDDAPDGAEGRDAIGRFASTRHADGDWAPPRPEDAAELAEVAAFWQSLDGIAQDPAVLAMRADARARIAPAPHSRGRYAMVAVASAVVLATVGTLSVGWRYMHPGAPAPALAQADRGRTIDNAHGQPRTIALADGSRVTLDTETRLRIYDAMGTRHAALERGRAFFAVRHDPRRPFQVDIGSARITDIGTAFEVSMIGDAPSVTLVEGAVRAEAPGIKALDMTPGSRLLLRASGWTLLQDDVRRRTEWRDAMISVDNRPLGEVVASLNRYLPHPLVVTDPDVAKVRISGTFQTDDPEAFAQAVTAMGYGGAVRLK
ncbi:FecR domain-containing protein [Sphingomonas sp.]|uniref:FecR family protein n=1 Tax=Sphingomonas sp. TaxID=28214 RepID=UPI0031E3FDCC